MNCEQFSRGAFDVAHAFRQLHRIHADSPRLRKPGHKFSFNPARDGKAKKMAPRPAAPTYGGGQRTGQRNLDSLWDSHPMAQPIDLPSSPQADYPHNSAPAQDPDNDLFARKLNQLKVHDTLSTPHARTDIEAHDTSGMKSLMGEVRIRTRMTRMMTRSTS
jgi:hypothetical protein